VPRELRWLLVPALCVGMAVVASLFAGLLHLTGIPAVRPLIGLATMLLMTGLAFHAAPWFLLDPCEYLVTDRQIIWRRGLLRRAMDRRGITYGRIHWHRSVPGVGTLELVRAVPYGPLARKQRLVLHDVEAPDRLFALVRGTEPSELSGYAQIGLTDRLDRGEEVVWGGGPTGWRLGHTEVLTAVVGGLVIATGLFHLHRTGAVLVSLEELGLPVRSATWVMLFFAIAITSTILFAVGTSLLWRGLWGARQQGSTTEYLLTSSRLLIKRGLTELSLDRSSIVDVAEVSSSGGSSNLHLILDGPNGRALDDNGALSWLPRPRSAVAPILYEVKDPDEVRRLLFGRRSSPKAPLHHAA
jgi:hypothetical protein